MSPILTLKDEGNSMQEALIEQSFFFFFFFSKRTHPHLPWPSPHRLWLRSCMHGWFACWRRQLYKEATHSSPRTSPGENQHSLQRPDCRTEPPWPKVHRPKRPFIPLSTRHETLSQSEAQTPTSVQLPQLLAVTHGRVQNQKIVFTNTWHLSDAALATRSEEQHGQIVAMDGYHAGRLFVWKGACRLN